MDNDSTKRIFGEDLGYCNWYDDKGNPIENLNYCLKTMSAENMREAMSKYMPIGSVLRLKNKIGLFMIIGYKHKSKNVTFDYLSVKYPGGTTNNAKFYMFNHDEIEQIHHVGMHDDIQKEYKKMLLKDRSVR